MRDPISFSLAFVAIFWVLLAIADRMNKYESLLRALLRPRHPVDAFVFRAQDETAFRAVEEHLGSRCETCGRPTETSAGPRA